MSISTAVLVLVLCAIAIVALVLGQVMSFSAKLGKKAAGDLLSALALGASCLVSQVDSLGCSYRNEYVYPVLLVIAMILMAFYAVRGAVRLVRAKKAQTRNSHS